jgi:hypothetical protein
MAKPTQSLESAIFNRILIRRLLWTLTGLMVLLIIAHVVLNIVLYDGTPGSISRAVDVDAEGNLATWFDSTLDMLAGFGAFALAWLVHQQPDISSRRSRVLGWILVGCVLFYLGVDDASSLHEAIAGAVGNMVSRTDLSNSPLEQVKWQLWIVVLGIPGIVILALVWRFFYRNIWHLRRPRWFVSIAVALLLLNPFQEVVEGRALSSAGYDAPPGYPVLYQEDRDTWLLLSLLTTAQEAGEILSVIFFLGAFLYIGESLLLEENSVP